MIGTQAIGTDGTGTAAPKVLAGNNTGAGCRMYGAGGGVGTLDNTQLSAIVDLYNARHGITYA